MGVNDGSSAYEPLTVERLGGLLAGSEETRRWRLVAEFLEECRWEPVETALPCWNPSPPLSVTSAGTCFWRPWPSTCRQGWAGRTAVDRGTFVATVLVPVQRSGRASRRGCARAGGLPSAGCVRVGAGAERRVSADDPLLDRAAIKDAFRRLGTRLARRGVVADLYIFGGAAMALAYVARRVTSTPCSSRTVSCSRRPGELPMNSACPTGGSMSRRAPTSLQVLIRPLHASSTTLACGLRRRPRNTCWP